MGFEKYLRPRVRSVHTYDTVLPSDSFSADESLETRRSDYSSTLDPVRIHFKICSFSGTENEDVDEILHKFDSCCDENGHDNIYRAQKLPFLLSGKAYRMFKNLSEDDKKDYEEICRQLKLNFGTGSSK